MIAIGSDHGGFDLKEKVIEHLKEAGYEVKDFGCYDKSSCDYPEQRLHAEILSAPNRLLVYLTDTDYALSNEQSFDCRTVPEGTITLPVKFNATVVEFWNPEDGSILSTEPITVENDEILLQLPAFQRAIALKIK